MSDHQPFKVIGDEIWFMGEIFAKITMPISIMRDLAEERMDILNTLDLGDNNTVEEMIEELQCKAAMSASENIVKIIEKWAAENDDEDFTSDVDILVQTIAETPEYELLK